MCVCIIVTSAVHNLCLLQAWSATGDPALWWQWIHIHTSTWLYPMVKILFCQRTHWQASFFLSIHFERYVSHSPVCYCSWFNFFVMYFGFGFVFKADKYVFGDSKNLLFKKKRIISFIFLKIILQIYMVIFFTWFC